MLSNRDLKDYSNAIASIGETLNQFAGRDQTDLKRRYVEKRNQVVAAKPANVMK